MIIYNNKKLKLILACLVTQMLGNNLAMVTAVQQTVQPSSSLSMHAWIDSIANTLNPTATSDSQQISISQLVDIGNHMLQQVGSVLNSFYQPTEQDYFNVAAYILLSKAYGMTKPTSGTPTFINEGTLAWQLCLSGINLIDVNTKLKTLIAQGFVPVFSQTTQSTLISAISQITGLKPIEDKTASDPANQGYYSLSEISQYDSSVSATEDLPITDESTLDNIWQLALQKTNNNLADAWQITYQSLLYNLPILLLDATSTNDKLTNDTLIVQLNANAIAQTLFSALNKGGVSYDKKEQMQCIINTLTPTWFSDYPHLITNSLISAGFTPAEINSVMPDNNSNISLESASHPMLALDAVIATAGPSLSIQDRVQQVLNRYASTARDISDLNKQIMSQIVSVFLAFKHLNISKIVNIIKILINTQAFTTDLYLLSHNQKNFKINQDTKLGYLAAALQQLNISTSTIASALLQFLLNTDDATQITNKQLLQAGQKVINLLQQINIDGRQFSDIDIQNAFTSQNQNNNNPQSSPDISAILRIIQLNGTVQKKNNKLILTLN